MSQTISHSGRSMKMACPNCSRTTHMIHVGTDLVAFEPEVIRVIRVGLSGSVRGEMVTARRAHREVCDTYQRADRRAKMRREQAEWRAEQKRKKKDKGL